MHLSDFPDKLSPMLVKELRQGLRTRSFIAVFLTLQIVLAVILLGAGSAASSDQAGSMISNIIFIFFSIAVILIQPMRGIGSLSSEIKGNTIDMMVLTRLSAWRIVTGKWLAIISQSALILVTIIPYLILRYFFGGMNLIGEVVFLSLIFITSAALTAITVGLSASGSVILRSILPMLVLPFGSFFLLIVSFDMGINSIIGLCSLDTSDAQIAISLYVAAFTYIGYFFLAAGTSLIAPYAENHSTLRRLIALGATILAAILGSIYIDEGYSLIYLFVFILTPIFAVSLTEFGSLVPPVFLKFSRYGLLGKLAGFFLLPGWASGAFFCILLSLIATIPYFFVTGSYDNDYITASLAVIGTLLFPAVFINILKMKGAARLSNYVLIGVATCIVTIVLLGITESMSNEGFLWLFIWIPPVSIAMLAESSIDDDAIILGTVAVDILYFVILFILAHRSYKESIREVEQSLSSVEEN